MGSVSNGAEPQNISEKLKSEIRKTLSRFFTKAYGDEVRNPVLFLNFLYQHSLITKPEYDIRPDPNVPFFFNGTCSLSPLKSEDRIAAGAVGPWRVEVEASSKKECKKRAAQKFLNLFLADEKMDVVNHCDNQEYPNDLEIKSTSIEDSDSVKMDVLNNQESPIDLGIKSMSIADSDPVKMVEDRSAYEYKTEPTEDTKKFYEDDLTGMFSFDTPKVFNSNELHQHGSYQSSIPVLEPQCSASSRVLEPEGPAPKLRRRASKPERKKRKPRKKKTESEPVPHQSSVFPTFHVKTEELHVPGSSSSSDVVSQGAQSSRLSDVASQSDLYSTDKSSLSTSSNSSSQISDDLKVSQVLFNVDYFDPFYEVRPKYKDNPFTHRKENASNVEKENSNCGEVSNDATQHRAPFGQNNKTPFQILQEKAVKNLRLIPRSRIEKKDDGFCCTLVLDANTGYGEGRTKKEAKLKAAMSLLQILGNL